MYFFDIPQQVSSLGKPTSIAHFNNHLLLAINHQLHIYSMELVLFKVLSKYQCSFIHAAQSRFIIAGASNICIYDSKYDLVHQYAHSDTVVSINYHPYLQMCASCTRNDLFIWYSNNNLVKFKFSSITQCSWTKDGKYLILCQANNILILHHTGELYHQYTLSAPVYAVCDFIHHITNDLTISATSLKKEFLLSPLSTITPTLSLSSIAMTMLYFNELILIGHVSGILSIFNYEGAFLSSLNIGHPIISITNTENILYICHSNGFSTCNFNYSPINLFLFNFHFFANKTDLLINSKMRIRCRHVILGVDFNQSYLLIHVPLKLIIYEFDAVFKLKWIFPIPDAKIIKMYHHIYAYDGSTINKYTIDGQLVLKLPITLNSFLCPMFQSDPLYYFKDNLLLMTDLQYNLTSPIYTFDHDIKSIHRGIDLDLLGILLQDNSMHLIRDSDVVFTHANVIQVLFNVIYPLLVFKTTEMLHIYDYDKDTIYPLFENGEILQYHGSELTLDTHTTTVDVHYKPINKDLKSFDQIVSEFLENKNLKSLHQFYLDFNMQKEALALNMSDKRVLVPSAINIKQQLKELSLQQQFEQAYALIRQQPVALQSELMDMLTVYQMEVLELNKDYHKMTQPYLRQMFQKMQNCLQDLTPICYYLKDPNILLFYTYEICYKYKNNKFCHFPLRVLLNAGILCFNLRRQLQTVIKPIKIATTLHVIGKAARQLGYYETSNLAFKKALELQNTPSDFAYMSRCLMLQINKPNSHIMICFICQKAFDLFNISILQNCVKCHACGAEFAINKGSLEMMPLLRVDIEAYTEHQNDDLQITAIVPEVVKNKFQISKQLMAKIHFKHIVQGLDYYLRLDSDIDFMICKNCHEIFDINAEFEWNILNNKCKWCLR